MHSDDEPPKKKLISDGDILIKQLSEKQRNTKVNLKEQLCAKSQFYKSTEVIPITSYISGSVSLDKFNSILEYTNNMEFLKSHGLTSEEIELMVDYKQGFEHFKQKHKNVNEDVVKARVEDILHKVRTSHSDANIRKAEKCARLQTELSLATKPTSTETKLLKFALDNQKQKDVLCGPMDLLKDIENGLTCDHSVDIRKIRKKARSLSRQIAEIDQPPKEPQHKNKNQNSWSSNSKWDMKETEDKVPQIIKTYTCQPQNLYTIRNGEIVKLDSKTPNKLHKLSEEEIRNIPKFSNYNRGEPFRTLYLKNLPNGLEEKDLENIIGEYSKQIESIKIMKGRMKGQAFIEFKDQSIAETVLDKCNGIVFKNKPIIIQFGKNKT